MQPSYAPSATASDEVPSRAIPTRLLTTTSQISTRREGRGIIRRSPSTVLWAGEIRLTRKSAEPLAVEKGARDYLADRIEQAGNVEVLLQTEIRASSETSESSASTSNARRPGRGARLMRQLFSASSGAAPRTSWLPPGIVTDGKGFVLTGRDLVTGGNLASSHQPFVLETSHRGVFATGDARHGSVKRVASAVGEGAMAIHVRPSAPAERYSMRKENGQCKSLKAAAVQPPSICAAAGSRAFVSAGAAR
jgi:hypothetical protein